MKKRSCVCDKGDRHVGDQFSSSTQERQGSGEEEIESNEESRFFLLNVHLSDGTQLSCDAAEGFHLVELMRAGGIPVLAECGGAGVCATCHIRVKESWRKAVPSPKDEELAKLDEIAEADEDSRLACQIVMTEQLDGLEIILLEDSVSKREKRGRQHA